MSDFILPTCICGGLLLGLAVLAPALSAQEANVTKHAKGSFEVKLTPVGGEEAGADPKMGRMTIDKKFAGDLEGPSKGQMLTAMTEVQGSAGYVAVERFSGTLHGRSGSFMLQHSGTMDRGKPSLSVTVVPDSGSGELAGITGSMEIIIEDGGHFYAFDYQLPVATESE
jgi:hypothetical protein